jgi:tetratricopeptide (TPR) repeat protein
MRLGRYEEGIPEAQREIELYPDVPLSYFVLGRAYQHLRNHDKAKANYEKVLELQPDHMNAYYGLYNICARLRLQEEAKRHLQQFKRLQKLDEEETRRLDETIDDLSVYSQGLAHLSFAAHDLYRSAGEARTSEALLQQAIQLDPNNTTYIERLVALCRARQQISDALAWCRRIAEIDPMNTTCQLNIGVMSAQLARYDEAVRAFRRAIELSPEHYGGYRELAHLYLRMRTHLPEAKQLARRAVELEPNAQNHFILGLACLANEDPSGAMPALKRATDLEPENARYARAYNDTRKRMLSR